MPTTTVMYNGARVEAETVEVEEFHEPQNRYTLADGSQIKIRTVVVDVVRIPHEYDQNGNPVYHVQSQNILTVVSPEHLREAAAGEETH